jgi:uncharacterized protein (TIGR03435 family)
MYGRWRPIPILLAFCSATSAQNSAGLLSFEAASVKPANQGRDGLGPLRGGPGTSSPGQLAGEASLKTLLMRAYELKDYQIGGPAWMESERYEIAAKIPEGATRREVALMLRSLLTQRFRLAVHRETRELAMYALEAAKSGPKLRASDTAGTVPDGTDVTIFSPKLTKGSDGFPEIAGSQKLPRSYEMVVGGSDGIMYKLWARRETMEQLADRLSAQLSRPVVDRTGLQEVYDFALTWTVENGGTGVPRTGPPPDMIEMHSSPILSDPGLSIFAALPAQLGLKLEARRGPLEMLIVDKADRVPIGN